MDLHEDARRGVEAKQVLQAGIYREAFRILEDRFIAELAKIEITRERAEYVRQLLVANRKIKSYLEQVMVTGQMAEQQITLLERMKDKARSLVR